MALDRLFPPALGRLAAVGSDYVDREGRTVALLPAPGGVWRFTVRADEVAPVMIDTLVATEDRHFWWHPGVDPLALARATFQALHAGRVVSGGSTLTMQVARMLAPRPRTWRAKLIEMARALQLEAHFSKRDILGMWLTLAPYGGNLEGVGAGALARLIHGMAAIRWRASRKALITFTELVVEAIRSTQLREQHPPCPKIPCCRSISQPWRARKSSPRSTAGASRPMAVSCCSPPPSAAWASPTRLPA